MSKIDIVVYKKLKTRTVELYRETVTDENFYAEMDMVNKLYPKDTVTVEHWVEKTNLMTGETYLEAPNTPLAASPASESYWSM